MDGVNPAANASPIPTTHEMQLRVRYQETDAQGHVHHANYLNYFEVARTEMLRASGRSYRELEAEGIMLVVVKATCEYRQGAKYDDLLSITTKLVKAKGVRITHRYEIRNGNALCCEGETVVAAVDTSGNVQRLPAWLRVENNGKP